MLQRWNQIWRFRLLQIVSTVKEQNCTHDNDSPSHLFNISTACKYLFMIILWLYFQNSNCLDSFWHIIVSRICNFQTYKHSILYIYIHLVTVNSNWISKCYCVVKMVYLATDTFLKKVLMPRIINPPRLNKGLKEIWKKFNLYIIVKGKVSQVQWYHFHNF